MEKESMVDIQKYIDWVNKGGVRRHFRIDYNRQGNEPAEPEVWCYSYDVMAGDHVALGDDPPTDNELAQKKADSLRGEISQLVSKWPAEDMIRRC